MRSYFFLKGLTVPLGSWFIFLTFNPSGAEIVRVIMFFARSQKSAVSYLARCAGRNSLKFGCRTAHAERIPVFGPSPDFYMERKAQDCLF